MITRLRMCNWRAYDDREVRFGPGITFLVGANGAGKTSILEAVCYALTGEPQTVEDRAKMLRDPSRIATVEVEFEFLGRPYVVERSQSAKRAESACLKRSGSNEIITSGQKRVTEEIARLLSVSPDFLRRIVYMAEGDVFRFLSQPPGEALTQQVESVLGLRQLDDFALAIAEAGKRLKVAAREAGGVVDRIKELGIESGSDLVHRNDLLEQRRRDLLVELGGTQDRIARHRRASQDVERLEPLLENARSNLSGLSAWHDHHARSLSVFSLIEALTKDLTTRQERMTIISRRIAQLEGERTAAERVLEVLRSITSGGSGSCPVCGKLMVTGERDNAISRVLADLAEADVERHELQNELTSLRSEISRYQRTRDAVGEMRNYIAHTPLDLSTESPSIDGLALLVSARHTDSSSEESQLKQQATQIDRDLADAETERAALLTVIERLRSLDYRSFDEARDAVVAIEARGIALRAAEHATAEVLARQRNVDLAPVFEQIAVVWNAFARGSSWTMRLDERGLPTLRNHAGREFDLSQFSGGEKTALLVMVHTLIAHQFSKISFLLIDEPLEHLDPINRRSLVQFLVNAYGKNLFGQAIITTFEESLVRRYLGDEKVRVIHL